VSFDRVARYYRCLETLAFGQQLQEARIAFVRQLNAPRRALVVGEGNGRFLAALRRAHRALRVDCVEASARMITLARRELDDEVGVNFIHADIRAVALPDQGYDLIVTHFFLDCFAEATLRAVVEKVSRAAQPDAIWLLADFREPVAGWPRWQARPWLRAMYAFFRLTSRIEARRLIDPSPFLNAAGFVCSEQRLTRGGMIKSELWVRPA
jgi:ubiquinone/menaquinone biosynthesis C-methylase UbiE